MAPEIMPGSKHPSDRSSERLRLWRSRFCLRAGRFGPRRPLGQTSRRIRVVWRYSHLWRRALGSRPIQRPAIRTRSVSGRVRPTPLKLSRSRVDGEVRLNRREGKRRGSWGALEGADRGSAVYTPGIELASRMCGGGGFGALGFDLQSWDRAKRRCIAKLQQMTSVQAERFCGSTIRPDFPDRNLLSGIIAHRASFDRKNKGFSRCHGRPDRSIRWVKAAGMHSGWVSTGL